MLGYWDHLTAITVVITQSIMHFYQFRHKIVSYRACLLMPRQMTLCHLQMAVMRKLFFFFFFFSYFILKIYHFFKKHIIYFCFCRDYPTHSRTKHKRPQKVMKHLNNPIYNPKDKDKLTLENFIPVSMTYFVRLLCRINKWTGKH